MKKMLFVMNPYAGQRRANRYLADILSIFNRAGYRVESYMTGARGEATDIVRQYAPEMDLVACCGGDGTFNETVNGLLHVRNHYDRAFLAVGHTLGKTAGRALVERRAYIIVPVYALALVGHE